MEKENFKENIFDIQFNFLFFIIVISLFFSGYFDEYLLAYGCMFLHESGHIIAALLFKRRVIKIKFLLIGINACINTEDIPWKEKIKILLSGPFINLILLIAGILIYKLLHFKSGNLYFFIDLNLYLLFFNLLPIIPLDGGEILKSILINRLGIFLGNSYLKVISYSFSFVLIIIGIFQITRNIYNISLLIIGIYALVNSRQKSLEAALMNIKHILYRRSRFLKRGIYGARSLVAIKTISLGEILKSMDYDRFHFIYVLEEDLSLIRVFTEQEIIDGMLRHNTEITLEELIQRCQ